MVRNHAITVQPKGNFWSARRPARKKSLAGLFVSRCITGLLVFEIYFKIVIAI